MSLGRSVEVAEGHFDGELVRGQIIRDRRSSLAGLDVRTELAIAGDDLLAVGRDAQLQGADSSRVYVAEPGRHLGVEADVVACTEVEPVEPWDRLRYAAGDLVKVGFHSGGELVVNEVRKVFFEEGDHGEGAEGGNQSRALLPHIITALDCLHDRGVGGRPANTEFLKSLDQGGLGEPGRRLGGVALRSGFGDRDLIAGGHLGENRLTGFVTRILVGLLHVGPAKALVGNHGATRSEDYMRPVGRPSRHADLGGIAEGVGHLGGDGALPDHLVDPSFALWHLGSHGVGMAESVTRRADCLVGLLGVTNLLVVNPGVVGKELGSKAFGHLGPGSGHRGVGQSGAVSPHVGDVALLVEVLGGVHGQGGRQA